MSNKYGLNIIWSEEDHGYIATCPEFPGLSAFGETFEDAIAEAKLAQELFIETYEQEGLPLPEPHSLSSYSGQFRLRIPPTLHSQLTHIAILEGVSLNQLILMILASRAGADQMTKRFKAWLKQMENRLIKHTAANNVECVVALMTASDTSTYAPVRQGTSTSGIPQFLYTKSSELETV